MQEQKNKLLIVTQALDLNNPVLGFFHNWVLEFAKHCERITVICLEIGEYKMPANVKVLSLGKEKPLPVIPAKAGIQKIKYIFNFYKYIWQERKNYDKVFVHMNPEYVVLGGLFWRILGKKVGMWYAHGYVPLSLKIAEKLSNTIFTSTKEGFRLESKKIKVVGQGIPINQLMIDNKQLEFNKNKFKIISVGRISPVKDYETLIQAAKILKKENFNFNIKIIGAPGNNEQKNYLGNLKNLIIQESLGNLIELPGALLNSVIFKELKKADLFVNMSHTGSLDKAILEAMAAGLPILTCNEALKDILINYQYQLMYPKKAYKLLASKIMEIALMSVAQREKIGIDLQQIVLKNHSLDNFIKKIIYFL